MMEWLNWEDGNWPDWKDTGKTVEVEFDDGEIISGEVVINDFFFNGEDEIPHVEIKTPDGVCRAFCDNKKWRYITPSKPMR